MNRNIKIVLASFLFCFVAASIGFAIFKESRPSAQASSPALSHSTTVYYFHGNARCPSCYKIEAYTAETINSRFAEMLRNGSLSWQIVNIDEMANIHFISDYNLYTKSVVLVEMKDGKQVRWKNLERIWDLLKDQAQFAQYIEGEVKTFLATND